MMKEHHFLHRDIQHGQSTDHSARLVAGPSHDGKMLNVEWMTELIGRLESVPTHPQFVGPLAHTLDT